MRGSLLRAILTSAAALMPLAPAPASATESGPAQIIGIPLTPAEVDQARLFCVGALRSARAVAADVDLTCDCFQLRWEKGTDTLDRLALAISIAPNSPQARSAVWTISHAQDGLNEARLETLSAEFRSAAQTAMASCAR
jgi:hypothetical protein